MQENEKIKVACYCRVSTISSDQANSFENQKNYFNSAIKADNKYELYKIYDDQGISGTKLQRPMFNKMLEDAGLVIKGINYDDNSNRIKYVFMANQQKTPKFKYIFVKDTSRLARNVLIEDITQELKKMGVFVRFLDINCSTEDLADSLIIKILQILAQVDSENKSISVRFGMRESAKNNRLMGRVPYGYRIDTGTNSLKQEPVEAEKVTLIFNLYASGMGGRKIVKYLKEHGIMKCEGKPFSVKFITPMLRNAKYCGINIRNMYTSKGMLGDIVKNSPKDWIVQQCNKDKINAIISKDLFDKCQDILNSKIITQKNIGQNPPTTPFGGLIYCGKCEGNVKFNSAGEGGKKYICRTRALEGLGKCDNDLVSLDTLEEAITSENYQLEMVMRKGVVRTRLKGLISTLQENLLNIKTGYVIDTLEFEITTCEKERNDTETLFMLRDEDDRADLLEKLEKIKACRSLLIKQLEKLKRGKEEIINDIEDIKQTLDTLSQLKPNRIYTRKEILSDIAKIIALPGGEVKVVFKTDQKIAELYSKHHELHLFMLEHGRYSDED